MSYGNERLVWPAGFEFLIINNIVVGGVPTNFEILGDLKWTHFTPLPVLSLPARDSTCDDRPLPRTALIFLSTTITGSSHTSIECGLRL